MVYTTLVNEYINKKTDARALLVALQHALERNDCTEKENAIKLNELKEANKLMDREIIFNRGRQRALQNYDPCGYIK